MALAKYGDGSNQPESNKPYMPFYISELCVLRTVEHWTNKKVRVLGSVCDVTGNECYLSSVAEGGGPFFIKMKMDLLEVFPTQHSIIQVFGEIEVVSEGTPVIQAKFYRRMDEVDAYHYNKSVEVLQKYVPPFVKRVKESDGSQE